MRIQIDERIFEHVPSFKLGVIHYNNIVVSESPLMIQGRLRLFQEQLYFELMQKAIQDFPGVHEWREVWKTFGADPSRYRPSNEALLRRIHKKNYLTTVHSAVDLNNFFSLEYDIPIGLYDLQKIDEDIRLHIGDEDTAYEGLNGRINHLNSILTLTDLKGPFGSPFIDSKRTSVNENTTSAMQFFFLKPSLDLEECELLLTSAGEMFTSIHSGNATTFLLSAEQPGIEI